MRQERPGCGFRTRPLACCQVTGLVICKRVKLGWAEAEARTAQPARPPQPSLCNKCWSVSLVYLLLRVTRRPSEVRAVLDCANCFAPGKYIESQLRDLGACQTRRIRNYGGGAAPTSSWLSKNQQFFAGLGSYSSSRGLASSLTISTSTPAQEYLWRIR
jgi:hypothetical protein